MIDTMDKEIQEIEPVLLTLKEVATILRVAPLTLKRWEKRGYIKPIRINTRGDRRYVKAEIDNFIKG